MSYGFLEIVYNIRSFQKWISGLWYGIANFEWNCRILLKDHRISICLFFNIDITFECSVTALISQSNFLNIIGKSRLFQVFRNERVLFISSRQGFPPLHLFLNCSLLSEGRPWFFGFLAHHYPGLPPDQFDYRELVFDPDPSIVSELGRFFRHGNLIIWFFRDVSKWGLLRVLGSLLSPDPMQRDRAGLTTWDISCPAKVYYDLLQPLCAYLLTSVLPAALLCCSY